MKDHSTAHGLDSPQGPFTCSYSGHFCGPYADTPSLHSIAVALGRICRFAGNSVAFYTVLQHSLAVSDLLPQRLKVYGLFHDATEAAMGDAPSPYKTDQFKEWEDAYASLLLADNGLPELEDDERKVVHLADEQAFSGEVWTIGPPRLRQLFPDRDELAEQRASHYLKEFPAVECINPGGRGVVEFMRRVEEARQWI